MREGLFCGKEVKKKVGEFDQFGGYAKEMEIAFGEKPVMEFENGAARLNSGRFSFKVKGFDNLELLGAVTLDVKPDTDQENFYDGLRELHSYNQSVLSRILSELHEYEKYSLDLAKRNLLHIAISGVEKVLGEQEAARRKLTD